MAARTDLRERSERRARILAEAVAEGREALRAQAARHARRPADAEEALQDACVEFLRHYEGGPGEHALGYLMLAVKHRAWALALRAKCESESEVTTTDSFIRGECRVAICCQRPGPAERVEGHEQLLARAAAFRALKPDQRTALLLHALGYSYREIAELRGWTYTKVNRCLAKGRAALRAQGGEIERLES
jgi:RNA polymerase sigma factor (sigma-70 family)